MNISLIKLITLISIFIGVVCGFLTLIPFIGGWVFFILICFAAVIEMSFLLKNKLLQLDSTPESAIIGSIIGFLSFIGFSIIYMPLVVILLKVFKYYVNYGVALALNNSSLWIIILVTLFMGVLSATINAFTGFLTYYIAGFIENIKNKE